MKTKNQNSEMMLSKVDECVSNGMSVTEACEKLAITKPTYYRWRRESSQENFSNTPLSNTAQHILDITEELIAEHGLNVSLREIAREAEVSIGTINYHFKSRNDLLYHIASRGGENLNAARYELLDRAEAENTPPLVRDIIIAFFLPGLNAIVNKELGLINYMRFLGRLVQDPDKEIQGIVDKCFGNLHKRFIFAFSRALSDQSLEDVYWRYTSFTGVFIAMTQNPNRINRISHGQVKVSDPKKTMEKLLPILTHMMSKSD